MNVVLTTHQETDGIYIGPNRTRNEWLNSDLHELGETVSQACKEAGIEPVIRVGGGASGYNSLATKPGVTDYPNVIPNFPWDVFKNFLFVPAEVHLVSEVHELPETHLYGTEPDATVEDGAIHGDDAALTQVIAVAAGADQSHAARAKAVLAQVPENELEEWNEAHEK